MQSALPLLLFLSFLFFSTVLILAMGYLSHAEEQQEEEDGQLASALSAPSFFGGLGPALAMRPAHDLEDRLRARVEGDLESEWQLAEEFVTEPSLESLFHRPNTALPTADSFLETAGRVLREERVRAQSFVSDPSLELLYGPFGAPAIQA